jgi:hypothetical protein
VKARADEALSHEDGENGNRKYTDHLVAERNGLRQGNLLSMEHRKRELCGLF